MLLGGLRGRRTTNAELDSAKRGCSDTSRLHGESNPSPAIRFRVDGLREAGVSDRRLAAANAPGGIHSLWAVAQTVALPKDHGACVSVDRSGRRRAAFGHEDCWRE